MRFASLLVLAAACSGQIDGGPMGGPMGDDDVGMTPDADTGPVANEAVARAQMWVDAKVPYCQAPNHHHDDDADCASTCTRPDNPDWDPYRSDCSGLVSWAWSLPAPGRVTSTFAPFDTTVSHTIQAADLVPGDAINNDHHIMLFKAWETPNSRATFLEEPGCSSSQPYAREVTYDVTLDGESIDVMYRGAYTAIRLTQ